MRARPYRPLFVLAALALVLLSGCGEGDVAVRTLSGYSMGTSYSVKLVATEAEASRLDGEVRGRIEAVNDAMSTYLPRSDLARFNAAPVGDWVEVSPLTAEVVELALDIARHSDGAFDPTVGPLVDLWGFGPQPRPERIPDEEAVAEALDNVGWQAIEVDRPASRLRKTAPRELDLSGIAKGFAVDRVAEALAAADVASYLVEVGGELRFSGTKPGDEPWRVAIETPDSGSRSAYRILEVATGAMATSGDYRNFYEVDGKRYSHTLNPGDGYPIRHELASVTVLGERSVTTDGYATAMLVLGPEKARTLAESLDLTVMLIEKTDQGYRSWQSERFEALFGTAPRP